MGVGGVVWCLLMSYSRARNKSYYIYQDYYAECIFQEFVSTSWSLLLEGMLHIKSFGMSFHLQTEVLQ